MLTPEKDIEIYWPGNSGRIAVGNKVDYPGWADRIAVKSSDDPGGTVYNAVYSSSCLELSAKLCVVLKAIKDPENVGINIASFIELEKIPK